MRNWLRCYIKNRKDLCSNPKSVLGFGSKLCYQAPGDLGVKSVTNAVINIRLVILPVGSGPKLSVGQWIAWWTGLPGGTSRMGKLCMLSHHSCHIYGAWRSIQAGGDFRFIIWGKPRKDGNIFYGENFIWRLERRWIFSKHLIITIISLILITLSVVQ